MNDTTRERTDAVVSEKVIFVLFEQFKQSSSQNAKATEELTEAITALLRVISNYPKETHDFLKDEKRESALVFERFKSNVSNLNRDLNENTKLNIEIKQTLDKINSNITKLLIGIALSFTLGMGLIAYLVILSDKLSDLTKVTSKLIGGP
ncbi:MAG: hypothetical protein ACOC1K_08155 [Nanoarchaeota archaeon]